MVLDLAFCAATMGLCDQPGGAHAHKTEPEIDEVEDQCSQSHAADKTGIVEPAHHRRVGGADQREGDVGEKYRPGD